MMLCLRWDSMGATSVAFMGGTSVAFNVSATLLLCLIRGGFLRFFHGTLVAYMFLLGGVVRL